ncbi:MAG TPA: hypothetical protein ENK23_07715 [Sorangium sp.]|nr:hypothetical protein [Sorangium sp.]
MTGRALDLQVLKLPANTGAWLNVSLKIEVDGNNDMVFDWNGTQLSAEIRLNGTSTDYSTSAGNTAATQVWRMRHEVVSDMLYWELSSDGNEWQEIGKAPRPASFDLSLVRVNVDLSSSNQTAMTTARFGGYNNLVTAEPHCSTDVLTDDFAAGIFGTQWSVWFDAGKCKPLSNGGALTYDVMGIGYCGHESARQLDMTGKTISTKLLKSHSNMTDAATKFGVLLADESELVFLHEDDTIAAVRKLGSDYSLVGAIPYDATRWYGLRLRENAGTVFWEYLLDSPGARWERLRQERAPAGLTAVVPFLLSGSSGAASFMSRFDDFNLLP